MNEIAEIAKMDAPPEYYHVANDGQALTELEALNNYFEFFHGHIAKEEFIILEHDKLKGSFAIFVPIKYKKLAERKELQIKNMLNYLAKSIYGMTRQEAIQKGICIDCQKPAKFYSEAGRKEYAISGLCEYCFDNITK